MPAPRTEAAEARRTVTWDPVRRVLAVGNREASVADDLGDNERVLRTYLALVAEQREGPLDRAAPLRRDDIVVLAELLDFDDDALEDRLRRLLDLSGADAGRLHQQLRRQRMTVAALGVGLLAALPVVPALTGHDTPRPEVTAVDPVPTSAPGDPVHIPAEATPAVAAVPAEALAPAPDAGTPTPATEAAAVGDPAAGAGAGDTADTEPAPPAAAPTSAPATTVPATDVGDSVRYERDPEFVPPDGVDIGDAMVIERSPAP